jgi:hypothetical protein
MIFNMILFNIKKKVQKLAKRFTPQLGRTSIAAEANSFPYFDVICFFTSASSGMSEHLGVANITLATASFKSMGQFLKMIRGKRETKMRSMQ